MYMQDGSLEALLQVHCNGLAGIFLRRAVCDCDFFCQLLRDEIKRFWPPTCSQQEAQPGGAGAQRSIKVLTSLSCK